MYRNAVETFMYCLKEVGPQGLRNTPNCITKADLVSRVIYKGWTQYFAFLLEHFLNVYHPKQHIILSVTEN